MTQAQQHNIADLAVAREASRTITVEALREPDGKGYGYLLAASALPRFFWWEADRLANQWGTAARFGRRFYLYADGREMAAAVRVGLACYTRQVDSLRAFALHVGLHRARVALLVAAMSAQPLPVFVLAHDIEKRLLRRAIWRFYGGRGNRRHARAVYWLLNALGRLIAAPLKAYCLAPDRAHFERLERIADVVDRHCDPVAREEFADAAPPLSDFLPAEDLPAAEALAARYAEIVGGLTYRRRRWTA